jgi:hypothetical protein
MPFFCHQVRYTTDGWTRSFPEEISPNAISVAFSDGGSVATIASTALLTATEAVSTWGKSAATACQSQALQKSKTAATGH